MKTYNQIKKELLANHKYDLFNKNKQPILENIPAIYPLFNLKKIKADSITKKVKLSLKLSCELYLFFIKQLREYKYPKKYTFGIYIPIIDNCRDNLSKAGKIYISFIIVDSIKDNFILEKVETYSLAKFNQLFDINLTKLKKAGKLGIFYHKSKLNGLEEYDSFYVIQITDLDNLITEEDIFSYFKKKYM